MKEVRKSFTLIELLLVIAIITILAGILLPALRQARDTARSAQCMSNTKQFGLAFTSYAADFNDYFPASNFGVCTGATSTAAICDNKWWTNAIVDGRYLPLSTWHNEAKGSATTGVWRCPEVTDTQILRGGGYGIHACEPDRSVTPWHRDWNPSFNQYPKLSRFKRPSNVICMGDVRSLDPTLGIKTWNTFACPPGSPVGGWGNSSSQEMAPRHRNSKNCTALFYDGHTDSMAYLVLMANPKDIFSFNTQP